MKKSTILQVLFVVVIFASCKDETQVIYDPTPFQLDIGGLPEPNLPEDNPLTQQGIELGKMLFYETRLSRDGSQACASCHQQADAFTDTTKFSIGVEGLPGKRQAMTVFNMAWHDNEFFWDGRAHLLRDQALLPIQDELEMNETLDNVIAKLNADESYRNQFIRAFDSDLINSEKIALALEQFMLSIVSTNSKYDQHLAGNAMLTESETRGMDLFFTEYNPFFPELSGADCAHCHSGLNFENDLYMNNGLDSDADFLDNGRENVTMQTEDRAKFKVPSLRNIDKTQPYMHDGRFTTLREVVDHYNEGLIASSTIDPAIENTRETGLFLTEDDKNDLVAFLQTLTDNQFLSNPEYADPF